MQNEAGDQNSSSSPTNRQVDSSTAKKIEQMTGEPTRIASSVIGTTITAGDTGGARSAVNKMSSKLENTMKDFQNATSQQKFKILSEASRDLAATATSMSSSMVTSTFDSMAPKLNEGLHQLYKSEYSRVFEETLDPALAKKAAQAAQVAKVPSIKGIENFIPCAMKNVTDKLEGNIASLLAPFLQNVSNFTPCIADQFTSGVMNSIIGSINEALAPLMGDLGDIFPGDIASMLREKADGLFGIAQVVECDLPTAASELGSKTNQWTVGKGPKNVSMPISGLANKLLGVANAAESLAEAAAAPGGITSNILTKFANGDVALSISLTAIISILSIITVPLIVFTSADLLGISFASENINITSTALKMALVVALPVLIGMIIRNFAENFISSRTSLINKITGFLFLIVFIAIWIEERDNIFNYLAQAGLVVLNLNIVMMAIAYFLAKKFASGIKQVKCISLECGLQNGTLAVFVATEISNETVYMIPTAAYALIMYITGFIFIWILRKTT